jgi:hypothetical protein
MNTEYKLSGKSGNIFIVELSFWRYLLIELLLLISKFLYEKEKKRLDIK